MSNTFLSKSSFLKGLQCHKELWLYKNHPELMDPVDDSLQAQSQIAHGEAAANAYLALESFADSEEIADIRKHLLKYCELDTFAMVKILEKLHEFANE